MATTTIQVSDATRERLRRCGGTAEEAISRLLDEYEDAEFWRSVDEWTPPPPTQAQRRLDDDMRALMDGELA